MSDCSIGWSEDVDLIDFELVALVRVFRGHPCSSQADRRTNPYARPESNQ